MPFSFAFSRRVVAGLMFVFASSCSTSTTSGDSLCSLLGPCGTFGDGPFPTVVGFPAQRVANNEGHLSAGDTLTLYVVNVTRSETACTARDTVRTAVRWAVSDTSVADVILGAGGEARIRAKKPGSFGVVMYTPFTGQIPAGAIIGPIWVCPGLATIGTVRVTG